MSADQYAANVIGSGIGYVICGLLLAFRRNAWARKAHKLAAKSDIALPGQLVATVARFQRDSYLFGLLILWIYQPAVTTAIEQPYGPRAWAHWLPWVVTAQPILCVGATYALTAWPRWKASGVGRVTHLRPATVRLAFTFSEAAMALIGAVLAGGAGGWGLWLASAAPVWWVIFAATCGIAVTAWSASARAIMHRPSSASNEIELGWDDLIRFSRVRAMTVSAAWLPAIIIFLADCYVASPAATTASQPLWPLYLPVAVLVVLYLVFRQGRMRWRQAWLLDTTSATG
jgi:hypothetical protein